MDVEQETEGKTKQQSGTAGAGNLLGCCLVSLSFLCDIHSVKSLSVIFSILSNCGGSYADYMGFKRSLLARKDDAMNNPKAVEDIHTSS